MMPLEMSVQERRQTALRAARQLLATASNCLLQLCAVFVGPCVCYSCVLCLSVPAFATAVCCVCLSLRLLQQCAVFVGPCVCYNCVLCLSVRSLRLLQLCAVFVGPCVCHLCLFLGYRLSGKIYRGYKVVVALRFGVCCTYMKPLVS